MRYMLFCTMLCGFLLLSLAKMGAAAQADEQRILIASSGRPLVVANPDNQRNGSSQAGATQSRELHSPPSIKDLNLSISQLQLKKHDLDTLAIKPWAPGRGVGIRVELTW